ncbi:haloacid dehalogenase type II [Alicyclobacillus acidoterrestris]|uniref:Haloacid dehalogenase type II n=1 Tax=Alicyclobacillus acidoterrestris (strain ATCC 49025 / DSM 3922 / CIP 106132 / NCIMB 13137 / GD3B) TaxID=1356854 RepID=T0BR94_ALIAG|nr:haloacid dehalogenase type II [Alicyclobacillus acidoterrestris]EPZ43309.1 hypothetical protein N007_13505 [Alicyclobacillus acidoterrestris ATCC 49025]UNO47724.1 haloacid dehalogenase type II [Alicyclobacillus acidoterrestris]GEO27375.1 haloacid dehalogenase [Alicyclobacillus acidoterrestris]
MAAIVFDSYGTLFDIDALVPPIAECTGVATHEAKRIALSWRRQQLDYAWNSVLMNRFMDFDKVTEAALRFALCDAGLDEDQVQTVVPTLVQAHQTLPLFDDVRPTLATLSAQHKLLMLSNGTFRSLQTLTNTQGILFDFDYILSTEPIRTYKPARAAYQLVLDTLACEKSEVVYVSGNHWDVTGAKAFGFKAYWLNRTGRAADVIPPTPDGQITSLHALVELL